MTDTTNLLAINGGSSSIKFAMFSGGASLRRHMDGSVDRIGSPETSLSLSLLAGQTPAPAYIDIPAGSSPSTFLIDWIAARPEFTSVRVVGHRVVHGLQHSAPVVVTPGLVQELRRIAPFDPDHLPLEIELIEAFVHRYPGIPQVLCFDTAFHRDLPRVAKLMAVPRRLEQQGVQRYGFHGLSYAYLMEELTRLGDPAASAGRVILAHLGSGASMAAVRNGSSIDTSMGFTPASGLPMSTRSGDLDPGLFGFLARTEQMTAAQFDHMANHESGLLGIAQSSSDVRELLALEARDPRAAEALALFCYQAKKLIGAYSAALGGLDTLVFAGGIGENAPLIRERICADLGFLDISIDPQRNARNAAVISPDDGRITVRVIRTDEQLTIARACMAQLALR
jgi:acetate kinase